MDQSMISYFANHGSRHRINNKPIQVRHNIWVLAQAYGQVVQFEPDQGVKKGKQVASTTKWGLVENVFLWLMERLPPYVSYHIFMNNYFTFFRLLTHLGVTIFEQQVWSTKIGHANALSLGTNSRKKKRNVATLNSVHKAKKAVQI